MTITAKYIGQSTVQISTSYTVAGGTSTYTSFATVANAIADAIIGTQPGNAGTTGSATLTNGLSASAVHSNIQPAEAVTFTADAGVTAQASSGWTMIDAFWGGDLSYANPADTPDVRSPQFTQVFRSLCKDGVMYKILILRYNMLEGTIWTSSCETWNATTHQPTNEVWTHFDCAPIGFSNTFMDMIVMVSPRWVAFTSFIGNDQGNWAGVFELDREDPNDTGASGYPCWMWMCNYSMLAGIRSDGEGSASGRVGWATKPMNDSYNQVGSLPRTRDGSTGMAALQKHWGFDLGFLSFPAFFNDPLNTLPYQLSPNGGNKFTFSGWAPTKRLTMPLKPILNIQSASPVNYGQANGLKILGPAGLSMNRISIVTDADGNASNTGTARPHWLLNNQWKDPRKVPWTAYESAPTISQTYTPVAADNTPVKVVSTGICAYVMATTRIYRVNLATFSVVEIATAQYDGAQLYDMKYDGERYIWVVKGTITANNIYRIDITSDTVSVFNGPTSILLRCIGVNGNMLLVGTSTQQQTQVTHTTSRSNPGTWTALSSFNTGTASNAYMGMIKVTAQGDFICLPSNPSSTNYVNAIGVYKGVGTTVTAMTVPNCTNAGQAMPFGFEQISHNWSFVTLSGNASATASWYAGSIIFNHKTLGTHTTVSHDHATTAIQSVGLPAYWNWTYSADPRYGRLEGMKYCGQYVLWNGGYGGGNPYMLSINLLSGKSTVPNFVCVSSTTGTTNAIFESGAWPKAVCDGSRVIVASGNMIKVIRNIHTNNQVAGAYDSTRTFGQLALPA